LSKHIKCSNQASASDWELGFAKEHASFLYYQHTSRACDLSLGDLIWSLWVNGKPSHFFPILSVYLCCDYTLSWDKQICCVPCYKRNIELNSVIPVHGSEKDSGLFEFQIHWLLLRKFY